MRVLSDGRVRRTESEWQALVKKFAASGQSEVGFCETEKLSRGRFREWRKRFEESDCTSNPVRFTRKAKPASGGFVELTEPSIGPDRSSAAEFELEMPGGVRLRWRA